MLKLLADENLDRTIVAGIRRQLPDLEFPIAQESGLGGPPGPELLAWAADHDRIVVSHDVATMTKFAIERIRQGHRMPGLFLVPSTTSASVAIEELLAICQCSDHDEWEGMLVFLPL